jgi:hypothetical protein
MTAPLYFPCLMDDDAGTITRRVGPAMTFADAILHLKQHYSGAWQNQRATAQPVSHPSFAQGGAAGKPE